MLTKKKNLLPIHKIQTYLFHKARALNESGLECEMYLRFKFSLKDVHLLYCLMIHKDRNMIEFAIFFPPLLLFKLCRI